MPDLAIYCVRLLSVPWTRDRPTFPVDEKRSRV